MCVFCAAVPTTIAAGAVRDAKQKKEFRGQGVALPRFRPILLVKSLFVVLFLAAAILVHRYHPEF